MFDLVNGIPVHPLVVHAVVVLVPLTVVGTIAIAVVERWRLRFGPLVVASAVIAAFLVPVATSSGEALERRVGDPGRHAQLGEQLIWFVVSLLVLSSALVVAQWRAARRPPNPDGRPTRHAVVHVVAVLAVAAALASGYQVYRVGESGAQAVWGGVGAASDSR